MSPDLYAIGDIHGSLESLERLLDKINPDLTRDRLLFVGDYIDRGPRSKGVVDYIIRLKDQAPPGQIICLKGNHEAMFLDFLAGGRGKYFSSTAASRPWKTIGEMTGWALTGKA